MDVAKKLTPQHHRFIRAYLGEAFESGAEAARMAGYAPKSANRQAWKLLNEPEYAHVAAELKRRRKNLLARIDDEALPEAYNDLRRKQAFRASDMLLARDGGIDALEKSKQDALTIKYKEYEGGTTLSATPPDQSQVLADLLKLRKALQGDKPPDDQASSARVREELESILDRLADDQDEADGKHQAEEPDGGGEESPPGAAS